MGAGDVRFGQIDGRCGRQRLAHPGVVLVAHRAEHQVEVVVGEAVDKGGEAFARAGVVGAVQHHGGAFLHQFEPPRPVDVPDPGGDVALCRAGDLPGERRRDTRVDRLVAPEQRRVRFDAPVLTRNRQRRLRHRDHLLLCDRHVGLRTRRLTGDLLDGLPEDVGVFERDRRDCRRDGVDDARRVVAPADPDLEHREVDVLPAEVPERHGRDRLEEGRPVVLGGPFDDVGP
ncbi:hypothetical protein BRC61_00875 [Halobacteriales archaeon QH_10_65_19]|nr:MAG: hypothetical protein BRC61_00875 [Halobacteriales archaeon QH_10_65_19]